MPHAASVPRLRAANGTANLPRPHAANLPRPRAATGAARGIPSLFPYHRKATSA